METRKNTLKLQFVTSAKVPSYLDVLKFMATGVKIPATDVHSVYKDENDQRFYVKFLDETSYNRFCNSVEDQYWFHYEDGSRTPVQLELASRQFKYVRLFNLPPETEEKEIAAALAKFGKIRQHVRERYPADLGYHVFSGIRGVYMEVEKEIPANLYIAHFRARVYYEGLKNKCFFCKAEGHMKVECPKLASLRNGAETGGQHSYSSVTANLKIATTIGKETASPTLQMTLLPVPAQRTKTNEQAQAEIASVVPSTSTTQPPVQVIPDLASAHVDTAKQTKPAEEPKEERKKSSSIDPIDVETSDTETEEEADEFDDDRGEASRKASDAMIVDGDQQNANGEKKEEMDREEWRLQQKQQQLKRPIAESLSADSTAGQGKGLEKKKPRGGKGKRGKGRGN